MTKSVIYNLISDDELRSELKRCLRNRTMEQKFLYLEEGAENYYKVKQVDPFTSSEGNLSIPDFQKFAGDHVLSEDIPYTFVSLGCGKSLTEIEIFRMFCPEKSISYIGVDSSNEMLQFTAAGLENVNGLKESILMRSDFSAESFGRELKIITPKGSKKIFCFFSNTFGNLNPTDITDILFNLLGDGERIWMDVRLRRGTSAAADLDDIEMYSSYLKKPELQDYFFSPLRKLGVPFECGKLGLASFREPALNAMRFQFFFTFERKTILNIKNETLVMLPGERTNLLQIFAYNPEGLVHFCNEHGFEIIMQQTKGFRAQFLFEKTKTAHA